jgi:hypothetical protein
MAKIVNLSEVFDQHEVAVQFIDLREKDRPLVGLRKDKDILILTPLTGNLALL